jgi:predicted dehydrogenase
MVDGGLQQLDRLLERRPKIETDFRRVLDDREIDAVVIATPDHWHAAQAVLAMDAGKHIYVEKPASHNILDSRAMVDMHARHPELVAVVGTQQRSGKHFIEAYDMVRSGALGKVAFARAWISHTRGVVEKIPDSEPPASLDYDMWTGPAPYRLYNANLTHYNWHWTRANGTGEMGNWGAHWLDVVRWFLDIDCPTEASGHGGTFVVHDAKEWPDTQTILYEYPELTVVWAQQLWSGFKPNDMRNGTEFCGDKATLLINRDGWRLYPRDGETTTHRGSELEQAHARNFAQSIRGETSPTAPLEEGVKTANMCHLGNITTTLGRTITFDPSSSTFPDDPDANTHLGHEYRAPWTREV